MIKKNLKLKRIVIVSGIVLTIILLIVVGFYLFRGEKKANFEVDRLFLKIVLKEGASTTSDLHILNQDESSPDFSIKVNELEEMVFITEKEFSLGKDEEKVIRIDIDTLNKTSPGVYLGNIEIYSGEIKLEIPVVIEIQTEEILFSSSINIIPQGKDLIPGQKLNTELKIFNLGNLGREKIELIYFINDFSGKEVNFGSEEVVIDASSVGISATLDLPTDLELGDYIFVVLTKFDGSVGTSSKTFKVVDSVESSIGGSNSGTLLIIIVIFGFFFLVFLILIIYSVFYKDRLLLELQREYKIEIRRQRKLIQEGEKKAYAKLKTSPEKKEYKKKAEQIKIKRINVLKETQTKRIGEFKKIKKSKNISELKKHMEKWKKQGYNTKVLEQRFKLPSIESVRKKISNWKKQGYNTGVLDKKLRR